MAHARAAFRPDIEGLRAVAVVLVVLNHLLAVPAGGFIGVDMFFVISGFVITAMLWRETSERKFSFRAFYVRRVRRLLPAALLVLLATNLAAQYFFLGPRVEQTREDSLWALAFLANVHMADTDTDYFHANDAPSLLQHYWSLAVEEQFYFVWPLLLVLLAVLARRRLGRALVLPVTVALTAASFLYAVKLVAVDPVQAYFSAPARAWELGAGAILGLIVSYGLVVPRWLQHAFAWMGVGLVVTACVIIDPTQAFPGAAALVPVGASVALILAGTGKARPRVTKWLSHPVSRYVGRISYPIYLWHWPVIVISTEVWGRNPLVWVAAPFVSVILAVLTHHLVEDPLRGRVKARHAYRELVPMMRGNGFHKWVPLQNTAIGFFAYALVLTSIAVTSVPEVRAPLLPTAGTVVASGSGSSVLPAEKVSPEQTKLTAELEAALHLPDWPSRLVPSSQELSKAAAPEWVRDNCLNVGDQNVERCQFGSGRRRALILGDSIAVSYLPGLRRAFEGKDWTFQTLTLAGCNNAASVRNSNEVYAECDAHREWAIRYVRKTQPDLVILSNATNISNLNPAAVKVDPYTTWSQGLQNTIRRVSVSAKRVAVIAPPPDLGNLQSCRKRGSEPRDCFMKVSRSWYLQRSAEAAAAEATGARHIGAEDWFCLFGLCPAVVANTAVTFDGRHLTHAYSLRLSSVLESELASILGRDGLSEANTTDSGR